MFRKVLITIAFFLLGQTAMGWASSSSFTVSATVPRATGIAMNVSSMDPISHALTGLTDAVDLSFDPMTYIPASNIYIPAQNFALDIIAIGGSGSPDITVTYSEGNNPNGTTNGLGYKATLTFAKEVLGGGGITETFLADQGPKKRLIDVVGQLVSHTELVGGFLRLYLGIWTGSSTAPADPANGQPFSNADAPGLYTGSLVVTVVIN